MFLFSNKGMFSINMEKKTPQYTEYYDKNIILEKISL